MEVLYFVLLLYTSVTLGTGFVRSPQNVTAYTGNRAEFTCTINLERHGQILWYVYEANLSRNVYYTSLTNEYGANAVASQEGTELTSVLSITASAVTNGTLITCKGDSWTNQDIFSRAYLSVQGQLAAPNNLTASVGDEYVRLSWEAPFTLPESDIEFKINVSIAGRSNSLTTSNPYQTFSYSSLNISRCDSAHIEFIVQGVNPAGEGLPAPTFPVDIPQDDNLCNGHLLENLGPPTSLVVTIIGDSVSLEWTPPFTLSEILYYVVEARNSNESSYLERFQTNETSHVFLFSDLNIVNHCINSYQLTLNVCGVNYAGEGNFSTTSLIVPQSDSYCLTSTTQGTVKSPAITTTSVSNILPKDMTLYIGIAAAGALVIMLVLIVSITTFIACYLLMRHKGEKEVKTELSDFKMDTNNCYGTAKVKLNQAYEQPLHIYDMVIPTTMDA